MTRPRKILLILVLFPLLLLGGAAGYLRWRFPPERLRAMALDWARDHLHRDVTLGNVRWGLFGVDITDLTIHERPGFPEGPFFSVQRVTLRPNIGMLFSRRLVVDTLHLEAPHLHLFRRADNTLNIDDLRTLSPPPAASAPKESRPGPGILIRKIFLNQGDLRWTDVPAGDDLHAQNLTLLLNSFSLLSPFDGKTSGDLTGHWGKKNFSARFDLEAKAHPLEQSLDLRRGNLSVNGSTVTLSGKIKGFATPTLDLTVGLAPFLTDSLAPFVSLPPAAAGLRTQGDLHLQGTLSTAQISGALALEAPGLSAAFDLDTTLQPQAIPLRFKAKIAPTKLTLSPGPWSSDVRTDGVLSGAVTAEGTAENLTFAMDLDGTQWRLQKGSMLNKPAPALLKVKAAGTWTPTELHLTSFQLESAAGAVTGAGRVQDISGHALIDLRAATPRWDLGALHDLLPDLRPMSPKGILTLDLRLNGNATAPHAQGTVALEEVGITPLPGARLDALRGRFTLSADALSTPELKGRWMGSPFVVSFSAQHLSRPEVSFNGALDRLDVEKTMAVFGSTPPAAGTPASAAPPLGPPPLAKLSGTLTLGEMTHPSLTVKDTVIQTNLAELGPDLSAWRGTLSVTTAEGKIRNIPLAKKLSQFLKKDTAEIPFQKISGRFQMARGLLTTDNFLLESKQADLSAKGNVRMTDMEANVALTAILPVGALGGSVGEWASGPDGRPRLSAKVTGPLTDPTLRADISKTAESAAKDLLKKGLEKWGVIPSSSVDKSSSTEKTVDRAVEQGKKALEKFFKRR